MPMNAEEMGNAMYEAVTAVANGDKKDDVRDRMIALAGAIIDHIKANATIGSLATTSTPADGPGHIHNPKTMQATGKIS